MQNSKFTLNKHNIYSQYNNSISNTNSSSKNYSSNQSNLFIPLDNAKNTKVDRHQTGLTFQDGGNYKSKFSNGTGTLHLPDGSTKYKGSIVNGKPHGKGTLYGPDGRVYKGDFQNNIYLGQDIEELLQERLQHNKILK